MSANDGVNSDNYMVKTANLPAPHQEESPSETIQQGPLTFNLSPLPEEGEGPKLAIADKQAKLMC
jgi:hypothetical protein